MIKSCLITGTSGFVGTNLVEHLKKKFKVVKFQRNSFINIKEDIVIHLAGKAHDLHQVTSGDEYYESNTNLTKKIFSEFVSSNSSIFIYFSSVKASADVVSGVLTEDMKPNPLNHYGISKLLAEEYILNTPLPSNKRFYILRPAMIHGPGNKGNLNLLYYLVSKTYFWPLGSFDNKRSFCSIDNLMFIIEELIQNEKIESGVYNIADDEPLSTIQIVHLIAVILGRKIRILCIPKFFIKALAKIGDYIFLPLNSERLKKLTENYIVSNNKIKIALNKNLPFSSREGIKRTIKSFNN